MPPFLLIARIFLNVHATSLPVNVSSAVIPRAGIFRWTNRDEFKFVQKELIEIDRSLGNIRTANAKFQPDLTVHLRERAPQLIDKQTDCAHFTVTMTINALDNRKVHRLLRVMQVYRCQNLNDNVYFLLDIQSQPLIMVAPTGFFLTLAIQYLPLGSPMSQSVNCP